MGTGTPRAAAAAGNGRPTATRGSSRWKPGMAGAWPTSARRTRRWSTRSPSSRAAASSRPWVTDR
eukprot:11061307-Lingulodinium_polyedra.AAC.1